MPAGRLPTVLWRIIQRNASVSADRYVLYHCKKGMSTDFCLRIIDKNRGKRYPFRVRGEQTVAGLRA